VFKLIIEDDEGHTTVVPLQKEEITIGRKEGNTIRLTERNVSRHHARLIRTNGSVFIEDLDSYNGIKVNGDRIGARTNVRIGDLIEIGDYHLALQEAAQAEVESAPPPALPKAPPLMRAQAQVQAGSPQLTVPDGGTAVMRLPVEEKVASDPGQVRPLNDELSGSLVVETTDLTGQVFKLNRTEITLGRTEENDIVLPHRSVSSRHAKLVFDGGIYRVMDLDSANGVLVNGEEYARVDIRKGDIIELGHVKLRYLPPGGSLPPGASIAVPAHSRRMVDASLRESEVGQSSGKGKLIGMIVGGLVVLAVAAFLVVHFMSDGSGTELAGEEPGKDDGKGAVVVAPDSAVDAVAKLPSLGDDNAKISEAEALFKEGMNFMVAQKWDDAIDKFSTAVTMNPDSVGARSQLEKARSEKKMQEAMGKVRKAVSVKQWDTAMEMLQETEIPKGSIQIKEQKRLLPEVTKSYNSFHLTRASRLANSGKFKDALGHVEAVLKFDEKNFMALDKRAQYKKKLRSRSKPRKPRESQSSRKEKALEWRGKGIQAYKKGNMAQAIKNYDKALKLNKSDVEVYRLLGTAYARKGKSAKAYSYYKKYLDRCPKCKYAPGVRDILKKYAADQ